MPCHLLSKSQKSSLQVGAHVGAPGGRYLGGAAELADAREAFYELSKLLVRYRSQVAGERPAVVYCAMAKKSWLQPAGDIGNPYFGPAMQVCGEVVEE